MMLHAIKPFKMTGKVQVVVIYCENSPLYFLISIKLFRRFLYYASTISTIIFYFIVTTVLYCIVVNCTVLYWCFDLIYIIVCTYCIYHQFIIIVQLFFNYV